MVTGWNFVTRQPKIFFDKVQKAQQAWEKTKSQTRSQTTHAAEDGNPEDDIETGSQGQGEESNVSKDRSQEEPNKEAGSQIVNQENGGEDDTAQELSDHTELDET